MDLTWPIGALKFSAVIAFCGQLAWANACVVSTRAKWDSVIHTTVSADGQMVAALWNAGTKEQVLCFRLLANDARWQSVKAPPLTRTIQFAVQGHDLLLTSAEPAMNRDVLARLNIDKPGAEAVRIHVGGNLAFPVEISPGRIMVRTRVAAEPKAANPSYLLGYRWIVVGPDGRIEKVGPDPIFPYSAPNIVGSGFFWVDARPGPLQPEQHPIFHSFALPGGVAPTMPRARFSKDTFNVRCDRSATRCLRNFISNLGQKPQGKFVYDIEVFFGPASCRLQGVSGRHSAISITPDGNTAVFAMEAINDKAPHVVAIKFNSQRCDPLSIQHFYLEEK